MSKGYIVLGWADHDMECMRNFGDALSPYIVEEISGLRVYHAPCPNKWLAPKHLLGALIKKKMTLKLIREYYYYLTSKKYVLAVGSILSLYKSKCGVVWGSGIISEDADIIDYDFKAVRGKYTQNRIIKLGFVPPDVCGDPAILLPLIIGRNKNKINDIGVVPHVIHYAFLKQVKLLSDYALIDLRGSEIERIVAEITGCNMILSTSLHGIIVAHAYGIPAVWCKVKDKPLIGDDVKFKDYFSSVDIEEYDPIVIDFDDMMSAQYLCDQIVSRDIMTLPRKNITDIQRELLSVAPFELNSKYKTWLSNK